MELPETDSEDELAPGWEERCTLDGQVFYAHHGTRTTQWTHPRTGKKKAVSGAMPIGWQQQVDAEGNVTFVHSESSRSTYTDPRLAFAVEETTGLWDLRQRFDASSTGLQVLHGRDLSGEVAVITGANSGIGYETARSLAFHGCTVVLACRSVLKGRAAVERITKQRPFATCLVLPIDLSSLPSVKSFVKQLMEKHSRINYLILNGGVSGIPYKISEDNIEETYLVNHLSHYYLAELLRCSGALKQGARVVWLTAESHRFASLASADDVTEEHLSPTKGRYTPIIAYNNSKLCNLMAAFEMQRRYGSLGVNSYGVHPGNMVCTGLTRHSCVYWLLYNILRPWTKTLQQACASSVYAACSPDLSSCGGVYINGCLPCPPSALSVDSEAALRLFTLNERLIERVMGSDAYSQVKSH